jgi:hypothetical protein
MGQIFWVCLHELPVSAKATPMLGDMETSVPQFFFLSFIDMNIKL